MKFNSVYIFGIIFFTLIVQSCEKMNDLHQPYLDEGEIIYSGKIDSVIFYPGRERIKVELLILSQRVESVRIFWNDFKDSVEFNVNQKTGFFDVMIENLDEGSKIFNFVSLDKFGNKSMLYEGQSTIYGERFQTYLSDRKIDNVEILENGEVIIKWSRSVAYGVYSELVYADIRGEQETLKIPMSESQTSLSDVDLTKDMKYRTAFLPEKMAIDTFYTEFNIFPFIW